MVKSNIQTLVIVVVLAIAVMLFFGGAVTEGFHGDAGSVGECGSTQLSANYTPDCGAYAHPYGKGLATAHRESFSSCYTSKQIYLNSCDPDEVSGHGEVILERRFGKLYITIRANLPYALGGVLNTAWGAYHAFLVDSKHKKSINLGSLVRHGDRMYKLSNELNGSFGEYTELVVYRQTEDMRPKMVLRGSIANQQCSSL